MQVKVLVAHNNLFGDSYEKQVDVTYELPEADASPLIEMGLVAAVDQTPAPADKAVVTKPAASAPAATADTAAA